MTIEQSRRQRLIHSLPRDRLLAVIADHLRRFPDLRRSMRQLYAGIVWEIDA